MIKRTIYIVLVGIIPYISSAQESKLDKTISFELGGAGLATSINYEQALLNKNKFTILGRSGIGYFPMIVNDELAVGTLNLILGSKCQYRIHNSHHLDFGLNGTFAFSIDNITENNDYSNFNFLTVPSLGYKYQKSKISYRVGYSPVLSYGGISIEYQPIHYKNYFYVGIGYSF